VTHWRRKHGSDPKDIARHHPPEENFIALFRDAVIFQRSLPEKKQARDEIPTMGDHTAGSEFLQLGRFKDRLLLGRRQT
jgi:hypothetical protein